MDKEHNAENRLILVSGATPMTAADTIIRECCDKEWFSDAGHTSAEAYRRIGKVLKDENDN